MAAQVPVVSTYSGKVQISCVCVSQCLYIKITTGFPAILEIREILKMSLTQGFLEKRQKSG